LKPWKPILLILLAVCLSISGCTSTTPPTDTEKVMLSADCGWQEIEDFGSREGRLVITDSIDGFQESHEFTGIKFPAGGGMVGDTAIFLGRFYPGGAYPMVTFEEMSKSFVTDVEELNWIIETLEKLTFSTVKNTRRETEARVVAEVFKKGKKEPDIYWVCADGIVLKEGEEDGYTCFYESSTPIDYYFISALQLKYEQETHSYFLSCAQITAPEQYRLCISSNTGHRDFTLEEARDLFSGLEGMELAFTEVVNPDPIANLESYLKITEYTSPLEGGENVSRSFYLSPEGRLKIFSKNNLAYFYWNDEQEILDVYWLLESEPVLDYSEFLKLVND